MRSELNYDFGQVVSSEKQSALSKFTAAAQAVLLADTDWTIDDEVAQLEGEIQSISDTMRVEETKKMVAQIERTFKKNIAEPVEMALNKPEADMWDKVLAAFRATLEQAEATYLRKATSFNCTDEENETALVALRRKRWLSLRAKIDEQTADSVIAAKLRNYFEDRFRYDEAGGCRGCGNPKTTSTGRSARPATRRSRSSRSTPRSTPSIPPSPLTYPRPRMTPPTNPPSRSAKRKPFDFASTLTIFTESRKADIGTRFRKESDALYVEAKRSTVSSIAQIPLWMYGVMVVLGWNEFMAVLSSPVYFAFLLVLIASAYVVWKLNLSGPMVSVGKAVAREVHRLADDQLRSHFSQPLPTPAVLQDQRREARLRRSS